MEIVIAAILSSLATSIVWCAIQDSSRDYAKEAIELGFAKYNSITGEWEWNTPK